MQQTHILSVNLVLLFCQLFQTTNSIDQDQDEPRNITNEELAAAIKANADSLLQTKELVDTLLQTKELVDTLLQTKELVDTLLQTKELVDTLNKTVKHLARQLVLSQHYIEEKTRTDGDSGVKQIRMVTEGSRNYHAKLTHTGKSFMAIHDHTNDIRKIGMGEVVAVMNGVEFRTGHNDYSLVRPSTTSDTFHQVEDIPFPAVPPEVLAKPTVKEQSLEMREWFKAWKDQDHSVRDYRQYFKPVLCYMEGAWTYDNEQVDESFFSNISFINAKERFKLEEKVRFTSYSGAKDTAENLPYLPKIIINVTEEGIPIFAQWNYRILCHPLSRDLPFNRLRLVDDLSGRMMLNKKYTDYAMSKAARFSLNPLDVDKFRDRSSYNELLEELMNEIPGKNNYNAVLKDNGYDGLAADPSGTNNLNAAYYHRRYTMLEDVIGHSTRIRRFVDQNLFMALTTHEQVVGMNYYKCITGRIGKCPAEQHSQKWTYAFPLEIIYMTPLYEWNPYNIKYKGSCRSDEAETVTDGGGRNGFEPTKPFNGTCHYHFYRTPIDLFKKFNPDPADTTPQHRVYVLDEAGNTQGVTASGTRIFFPDIYDVGRIRQRFPIAPVHGEGSAVWKELEALQDIVLSPVTYSKMYYEHLLSEDSNDDDDLKCKTAVATIPAWHYHTFSLTVYQKVKLQNGEIVTITTGEAEGHTHTLELKLDKVRCNDAPFNMYKYISCDGKRTCWDHHDVCIQMLL